MPNAPTIVITGATNGIGRIAAKALGRDAGRIVLIARSEAKADAVRAEILQSGAAAEIDFVYADFASLASVAKAASAVAARHERIDCLINNAGIHAFEQRTTEDGFAEMTSVNYLAPWLLTAVLRARIAASSPSRIVTVASQASLRARGSSPDRDLLDDAPFSKLGSSVVYGRTKLMNIMFSLELARQLSGTGVAVNCLDPGFNVTGLGRELPFAAALARLLQALRVGTPERGAALIVRLAKDPEYGAVSGKYFSVRNAAPITPVHPGNDADAQRALWKATADILRDFLPESLRDCAGHQVRVTRP